MSEEAPTVRLNPRYLQLNVGDPVEFRCTATGKPQPTLEWTGGQGGRLNPESSFVNGVFRIPSVRRSDEAEYYCSAKNTAGSAQVRTIIYVSGGNQLSRMLRSAFARLISALLQVPINPYVPQI